MIDRDQNNLDRMERMKNGKLILLIIIFVLLTSLSLTLAQPEAPREREITIEAYKFAYNPEIIEVNQGDKVTIRFISTDVHHGLYIDGYELKTDAIPGHEGEITFVANKTGKFTMRCSVTCGAFHPYMISYLKVKPDYRLFGSILLALILFLSSIVLMVRKER